jgi:DNA polymerase-3 subunit delta
MAPSRITVVVGSEPLLVDRAVAEATAAVRAVDPGAQRVVLAAAADDSGTAIAEAAAPTLFGDGTVIVVTGIDGACDSVDAALRAFADEPPDDAWLVCTHPGGVKGKNLLDALRKAGARQVDCAPLKRGSSTMEFLAQEVSSHRRKMTPGAQAALYEAVGQDLRMLVAAVSQLVSDVEHDPINEDDVRAHFWGVADVTGFAIADAVWDRRATDALRSLRQALAESDQIAVPTVMAIAAGLRSIVRVAAVGPGASEADVAREAGVPPWKVKVLRRQWSRWSADQRRLAAAVIAVTDADASMKGGVREGSSLDPEQKLLELQRLVMIGRSAPDQAG